MIGENSQQGPKKNLLKLEGDNKSSSLYSRNVKLSLLGVGLVFGDDDVLSNRPYKASLKCV